MQFLLILFYIFANLMFILSMLAILFNMFDKQCIGYVGEFWVRKQLNKLSKKEYFTINNLLIKSEKLFSQIDHVVVSKYGIFVIETKKYNGSIEGNEYDKNWLQNKKVIINNPIHQNYGHVKCLEEVLNFPEDIFIPIVCIPSPAELNIKAEKNVVLRWYELNEFIVSQKNEKLKEYVYVYYKLLTLNQKNPIMKIIHNNIVKQAVKEKMENYDSSKCPLCGNNLVERNGQYGKFLGCSNYPKCKYTRKLKK